MSGRCCLWQSQRAAICFIGSLLVQGWSSTASSSHCFHLSSSDQLNSWLRRWSNSTTCIPSPYKGGKGHGARRKEGRREEDLSGEQVQVSFCVLILLVNLENCLLSQCFAVPWSLITVFSPTRERSHALSLHLRPDLLFLHWSMLPFIDSSLFKTCKQYRQV